MTIPLQLERFYRALLKKAKMLVDRQPGCLLPRRARQTRYRGGMGTGKEDIEDSVK